MVFCSLSATRLLVQQQLLLVRSVCGGTCLHPRFLLVVLVHRRHPEVALYEINSVLGARVAWPTGKPLSHPLLEQKAADSQEHVPTSGVCRNCHHGHTLEQLWSRGGKREMAGGMSHVGVLRHEIICQSKWHLMIGKLMCSTCNKLWQLAEFIAREFRK